MHSTPTDRLIAGAVIGTLVTAAIVVLLMYLDVFATHTMFLRVATPVSLAALGLFPRPALLLTVWKSKVDAFTLPEDLQAVLVGRAFGLVLGTIFGVVFCAQTL